MPCMFMVPSVMTIHTSMAVKHFARLAGEDPLIFAGDFNFTPDSACYKLATQGERRLPVSRSYFFVLPLCVLSTYLLQLQSYSSMVLYMITSQAPCVPGYDWLRYITLSELGALETQLLSLADTQMN